MTTTSYDVVMNLTNPKHMGPLDSPYAGSGNNVLALEKVIGAGDVTRGGTFEQAMLQALDKVSGAHKYAEGLAQTAIIDPNAVDVHDVTTAEAMASMSLNITSNILNRLVQSWRDIINTR